VRRYLLTALIAASVVGVAAPAVAQSEISVGDSAQVEAVFDETDGACGFADFNDTYVATASEDAQGRSVDLVQPSTGDSAQLRLNQDGNPVIEPAGTDETYSDAAIDAETGAVSALYSYTDDGCSQVWLALFALPPGFFTFLAEDPARIAVESAPPVEEEVVVTESDPAPPVEEEVVVTESDPAPPVEEEVVVAEEEVAVTNTSTGGDSGLSFFFWILIAVFVLLFGWGFFWFFFRRPQRLYRFDRGDPGEFIDEDDQKEIVIGGEELPTFGPIAETEVEQIFLPPRASDILIDVPPSLPQ